MKAMASYFIAFFIIFIDKVNKIFIIFTVYFVIQDRKSEMVKMGADLVEAARFWGSFDKADFAVFRMGPGAEGFEFGDRGVGAGNDGLADIDPTGLVFAEAVKGLVDDSGRWGAAMNNGLVGFMNFPALLHFSQKRGVLPASRHQKKAGGFAVEPANEGQELARNLFPEPIDEGEGSVRAGGVNQPSGWLVHDEETGIRADDSGLGFHTVMRTIPMV